MAPNDGTFQVPLPQMLDLALGTPEVGSVNFNILHNFLHILLRQTSLNNAKAEYRGDDAARIKAMVASLKDGSNFYLHESDIIDMHGNIVQEDYVPDKAAVTMRTAKNFRRDDEADNGGEYVEEDVSKEIHQINNRVTDLEMIFEDLQDDVSNIQEIISKFHPEQTWEGRGQTLQDNEEDEGENNEEKDLSKNPSDDKMLVEEKTGDKKSSVYASKISGLTTASLTASKASRQFSKRTMFTGQLSDLKDEVKFLKNDMAKMIQDIADMRYDVDQLVVDKEEITEKAAVTGDIIDAIKIKSVGHIPQTGDEAESFIDEADVFSRESLSNSEILTEDQSEYSDGRKSSKKPVSSTSMLSKPDKDLTNDNGMLKESKDEKRHEEVLKKIDSRAKILEQVLDFDKSKSIEVIKDIIQNIKNIELDFERINWTVENLNKEKETRDKNMDILTEQVELLKITKADREDLEDALASKADTTVVNRKVSYTRFDPAYEELTIALEDAQLKSNQQEFELRETLNTVQQEIGNKLDKTEMSPLQEYVEEQFQTLQDELRKLTTDNYGNEAAGTKKILTGLQCITCDRGAVMKREHNALDHPYPMPYRKNIKPYLTYKLDQTRKHPRQLPAKNINLFTAAVQEMNKHKLATNHMMEKSSRDHYSNRYCGGSHTITTPQQRVMRMGHFLVDWGPDIIQLNEGAVRGTDGQLYHGRPMPPGGTTNVPKVCGADENVCCNFSEASENFKS